MENTKMQGRTMLTDNGSPVQIAMVTRPTSSAPSRIKVAFVVPTQDEAGQMNAVPLPFAVPTIGIGGKTPRGFTPEFRLEMN